MPLTRRTSKPCSCLPLLTCLLQAAPLTPGEVADLIDSGNSAGGGTGRHWVLDPIDGTRGFVGMRQYAVCLGMLEQGEVRSGKVLLGRRHVCCRSRGWAPGLPWRADSCVVKTRLPTTALLRLFAVNQPAPRAADQPMAAALCPCPPCPGGAGRAGLPQPASVRHQRGRLRRGPGGALLLGRGDRHHVCRLQGPGGREGCATRRAFVTVLSQLLLACVISSCVLRPVVPWPA